MAGEDPKYLAWIRQQPCAMAYLGKCRGGVQAHHSNVGGKGMSQRDHDHTCIPFCSKHHREWHDISGCFEDWQKAQRKAWTLALATGYTRMYTGQYKEPPDWDDVF